MPMCVLMAKRECESGWKIGLKKEYYREIKKKPQKKQTIKTVGQGEGNRNTSTHRAPLLFESDCIRRTQEAHRK